jgi:hypothetical protein
MTGHKPPKAEGVFSRYFEHASKDVWSAIAIALVFFFWSDFIDRQPNLNGTWYFTGVTIGTAHAPYRGMKVTYEVNLLQDKLHLTGFGEKIRDEVGGKVTNYTGKDRAQIEVTANITHRYFSRDTLELQYSEAGAVRRSSTFQKLVRYSDEAMSGSFSSTIASSRGPVEWRRAP